MHTNMFRNSLLNTTAIAALCGLTSVGAFAQTQFNSLLLTNAAITVCVGSTMPVTVNIRGTAATDGVFTSGISQDAFGLGSPTVDGWNTFLQNIVGLSSFGPGVLATYEVPAGTPAGVYQDNLFFTSVDAKGTGAAITPFTITVMNVACGTTPEPGNVAMLVGMGLTGAGFLIRRRRK